LALPEAPVRISVSRGRERRPVPDVGRLRGDRARIVLEAAGFEVALDSVQNDLPRGRIVSLEPAPGTDLPLPGQVRVTVSTGPPQVTVPLLVGMSEAEARDTLTALGLVVSEVEEVFRFGSDQGRVVDQAPPAESVLERGSAVRLLVGRGDTLWVARPDRERNKRPRRP
jgi:serine/threonine-protein kinase